MKIVVNRCYGGFSISKTAAEFMAARGNKCAKEELENYSKPREHGVSWFGYGSGDGYKRDDPDLVAAVETLKEEADGTVAKLEIVEIPDGIDWHIEDYDGLERVAEKHRTW